MDRLGGTIMILNVNVVLDKSQFDRIKTVNSLPGLVSVVILLFIASISESLFWINLASAIAGVLLIYFLFYLNAKIEIAPDFLMLKYKDKLLIH